MADGAELALPGQIIVQSNGLVGDRPPDPTTIATAQAAGAMLAWQTNEWELHTGGAACSGTRERPVACTASAFYRMLKAGIYPNGTAGPNPLKAQYLELFAPNVLAFPNVVLQARGLLANQ